MRCPVIALVDKEGAIQPMYVIFHGKPIKIDRMKSQRDTPRGMIYYCVIESHYYELCCLHNQWNIKKIH